MHTSDSSYLGEGAMHILVVTASNRSVWCPAGDVLSNTVLDGLFGVYTFKYNHVSLLCFITFNPA